MDDFRLRRAEATLARREALGSGMTQKTSPPSVRQNLHEGQRHTVTVVCFAPGGVAPDQEISGDDEREAEESEIICATVLARLDRFAGKGTRAFEPIQTWH